MQEQMVRNYNRGRFFRRTLQAGPDYSASLGLSMIKAFLGLSFLNMARAINAPNPFTFIQNNTFFSLFTNPLVNADDHYTGWSAYESLVDAVAAGGAGPITQTPGNYYSKTSAWYVAACDLNIMLDTNGTAADSQPFLERFSAIVGNDTVLNAVRSKSEDECRHASTAEAIMYTILIIIAVLVLVAFIRTMCIGICKSCERRDYDSIGDAPALWNPPLAAVAYNKLTPQLASPPAVGTPGNSNDVDVDPEAPAPGATNR